MVCDQQVGPCPTRPMRSYATGGSSGWLSNANGIGCSTQLISKEADPQVCLAIVLNPAGTQQCGSLNFPSNPFLMLRLLALQTHAWFQRDSGVLLEELLQLTFSLPRMAVHTLQTLMAQSTVSQTALTGRNSMFVSHYS